MNIPLLDLKAQYASIRDEVRASIDAVCETQHFILGPVVEQFEKDVAAYSGVGYGVGMSSGSDALLAALMCLQIKPGDEVITTPYSFFATAGAVARLGAVPVFVDIEAHSYNIDPNLIERAITPRTRAIMPVHLFGQVADMDPILDIARRHRLPVVEDAAQAIGAEYRGRRAGSFGVMACFSFFPSKNLGGFGDGGMVVTDDASIAERLRILRSHGAKPKYYHSVIGGNFRLDAIQAAILQIKLRHLDRWTQKRQENAARYDHLFAQGDLLVTSGLQLPEALWKSAGDRHYHIYNQYTIRVKERDRVQAFLRAKNVGTEVYYPVPLHLQRCFDYLGHTAGSFANAEVAAQESLAVPVYPELTPDQIAYVVEAITEAIHQRGSVGGTTSPPQALARS